MPESLRIFISSPADVNPERRRCALVIEKLAKEYARFFEIEPFLWEAEPQLASEGHFQDPIVPPSETDIVVLILWSRLGTSLPPQTLKRRYCGIDGRVPVTGTEWEFENALQARQEKGAPDLLAYRKTTAPVVSLKDRAAKTEAEAQWDKLEVFWSRHFVNRGQFIAAFSTFETLETFEDKLENDLRKLIVRRINASEDKANRTATGLSITESSLDAVPQPKPWSNAWSRTPKPGGHSSLSWARAGLASHGDCTSPCSEEPQDASWTCRGRTKTGMGLR
jgi:hypothetical protein